MKAARVLEVAKGSCGFPINHQLLPSLSTVCNPYQQRRFEHAASIKHVLVDKHAREKVPEVPTSAKSSTLGNLKRGRGGRSSFSGIVATVFGPSGFVGPYMVNELGRCGSQVIVAHRCDADLVKPLKVAGDLGQIIFHPQDIRDEAAIKRSVKYSNVVINLVGRDYQTKNFTYDQVHVEAARRVARIAKEAGVERLIHVSALGASENPARIFFKNGSKFLISKGKGEAAVLEEFPDATIFRPADLFGEEDRFINYYCATAWRRIASYMPMYKKGEATVKQPVFVGDFARGIMSAITDATTKGKIVEALGPRRYQLAELVDYWFGLMRKTPALWGYYRGHIDPLTLLKTAFQDSRLIMTPKLLWDKMEREYLNDVRTPGVLDLEDLGVRLKPIEDFSPFHLKQYRQFNSYTDELGEFPPPPPPRYIAGKDVPVVCETVTKTF